jgi:ribosome biogenesis protein NSA1
MLTSGKSFVCINDFSCVDFLLIIAVPIVLAEVAATAQNANEIQTTEVQTEDEMRTLPVKRKKASKEKREKRKKSEESKETIVLKSKKKSRKHKREICDDS